MREEIKANLVAAYAGLPTRREGAEREWRYESDLEVWVVTPYKAAYCLYGVWGCGVAFNTRMEYEKFISELVQLP